MVRCGTEETYVAGPSSRNVIPSTKVRNRTGHTFAVPFRDVPNHRVATRYAAVEQEKTMLTPELSRLKGDHGERDQRKARNLAWHPSKLKDSILGQTRRFQRQEHGHEGERSGGHACCRVYYHLEQVASFTMDKGDLDRNLIVTTWAL